MDRLSAVEEHLEAVCDDYERNLKAVRAKLDHKQSVLAERLNVLNEKKLDTAQAHGDPNADGDDIVEINAGGKVVAVRRSTLMQLKGSSMEALFSGRWDKELQRDAEGRIFLDVNPTCFREIVNYLNDMAISSQDDRIDPPRVSDEHKHILRHQMELFGLLGSKSMVEFPESCIIKYEDHVTTLHDWLEEDGSDGQLELLYRSSQEGQNDSTFHTKCDNQGCTFTIVKTTNGYVLGGYSNTPWTRTNGVFHAADKAFLFLLSGSDVPSPFKLKLKDPNSINAVWHNSEHGPVFGKAPCDFAVENSNVYLKFGGTYENGTSGLFTTPKNGSHTCLKIDEMEVFKVAGMAVASENTKQVQCPSLQSTPITRFTEDLNEAINGKQEILLQAESEMADLEDSFNDEKEFIASFASGDTKDVVMMNVSGTIMGTKRSTLRTMEESVLAQQFDDSKWTEQGCNSLCTKGWTPDNVAAWAENIEGIQEGVGSILKENGINGCQLLELERDDFIMIGIEGAGTLRLLLNRIKTLKQASVDAVTLIEHSPYCFGKILDYLRLKQLYSQGLAEEPPLPTVCSSQTKRFENVVKYYFPGDGAKLILG